MLGILYCGTKWKQTLGIPFRPIPRKRKILGIQYRGTNKETLGIPFRTIPRRRKQLRILFCGTKIFFKSVFSLNTVTITIQY
jgi:hypothetical protein